MAFLQGRGQVSMTKPAPNWNWNRLSLAASGLSLGLQLCSWITMWEQQSFHGASLICNGLLLALNQCQLSTDSPSVKLTGEATLFNSPLPRKKMYQPASYLIRFSSSGHCWKHLLLRDTLVFNQTWNDGMTDVQRPPTLTLRSRTGAAKPTLWPTLNPCHFTVPCFIFKTKTFSFSSKQALSNNVFGVKIGRTITLRRLFKVINFRRLKFVCTLWPCPVFGMCAAGPGWQRTWQRRFCPVARTQKIILQVVYSLRATLSPPLTVTST